MKCITSLAIAPSPTPARLCGIFYPNGINYSMLVFAGSSNQTLAKKLARELGIRLGKIELSRFSNDEARVFVNESNPGKKAVLVQSLSAPTDQNLVEFCLIADALQR